MITVTASPVNTFTPVVDGATAATSLAVASGAVLPEGFSTALNTQLGLLVQPTTNVAMLTTPISTMLTAMTTAPINAVTTPAAELMSDTAPIMTPPTLPQVVSTTNASSTNPVALDSATITAMSAEDTAILSAVTDMLEFITSGAKLGDTLPAGQSVQLPTANAATVLTQESMQSAVKQAVINTPVNTPASVIAQQMTPVPSVQSPVITTAAQVIVPASAQIVQTPVTMTTQVNVPEQAQSVQTPVTASVQIVVQEQAQTVQTPVTMTTQMDVPEQAQAQTVHPPVISMAKIIVPEQAQTVQTSVTAAVQIIVPEQAQPVQTSVTTAAKIIVSESVQTAQIPVTTAAQIDVAAGQQKTIQSPATPAEKMDASEQAQIVQSPVTTTIAAQMGMPESTKTIKTPVTPVAQNVVSERTQSLQMQIMAATPVEVTPQTLVPTITAQVQNVTTPITPSEVQKVVALNQPVAALKTATQTPVTTDVAIEPVLVVETASLIVGQGVSVKPKISDTVTPTTTESEQKTIETQDVPIVSVVADAVVSPLVTAQAAPIHAESIEKSTETMTTTTEKPTLTSAKTLLMDAVANRNTSGDAANNGSNNGGNTPSNPTLQGDALLNQTVDNKPNTADLKPFASLLMAEKSDVIGASATASTSDKSAPQAITTAVNKLVQDTKIDVPAMTKPLSHPEWNQDMGERIVWMNTRGISSAEIKMNPQNMGPITVRIDMNQDQATIAFTAQNSEVRTALEASIPKLREMLTAQNVNLAEVNVSQQSASNDSGRSPQQTAQMMADASANGQGNRQTNQEVDAQGNPVTANNADGTADEFAAGQVIDTNGTNGLLSIYA